MDREELHRSLSDSVVTQVSPDEMKNKSFYALNYARYAGRRSYYRTRPAAVAKARGGGINGFDPGGTAEAVGVVAPYVWVVVDTVLDHLLGEAGQSLGSRIWARITRRRPEAEPACVPPLTPDLVKSVEDAVRDRTPGLDPKAADAIALAVVKEILAWQEGGASGPTAQPGEVDDADEGER
ncbi:hypothetical protein ACWEQL_29310 [Kitasatospora sp. NPDC004240]